ncbi:MAG: Hsp20/alpha crystallin family protein [Acidimicrobiales bacterium]
MRESKTLDRRGDATLGMDGLSWPSWTNWPSRRWLDEFLRDSTWHQMIKIEECREGDALVVRAELPGVDPVKDIQVEVRDGALVISADKSETFEKSDDHFHRSEFRYGALTRSVELPKGVDESSITATYKDGVLEVRMALPAGVTSDATRRIKVQRS